jgi:hypothetical protein
MPATRGSGDRQLGCLPERRRETASQSTCVGSQKGLAAWEPNARVARKQRANRPVERPSASRDQFPTRGWKRCLAAMKVYSALAESFTNFAAGVLHPGGPPAVVIPPALYQINPKTGDAKWIAPTDFGLTSIVTVNDTVYALKAATGQVVTLEVATGQTSAVSDLDPAARLIGGATLARPALEDRH